MHHHFSYKPPGPVAAAFIRDSARRCGIMGPIGGGKSTASVAKLTVNAFERQRPGPDGVRRRRTAIIRNSYPELKTTTIKTWHQWWPQHVGRWRDSGPPQHTISVDGVEWEVIFVALDRSEDVRKLLSLELSDAWINEAREVPKAVVDHLSVRVDRYPSVRDGGCDCPQIIMDTNASSTRHWWYALAEKRTPPGWSFFKQPPAIIGDADGFSGLVTVNPDAENLKNLSPTYYSEAISGKSQEYINVYLRADYGTVMDGRPVYPEYHDNVHCRPIELVHGVPLEIGLDFGLTPAAVVGQRLSSGRMIWTHELVTDDMGTVRFAEELGRLLRGPLEGHEIGNITGDPAGDARSQTDERTVYDILRAAEIKAKPASSNDFTLRREAVARGLSRLAMDGIAGLLIHPRCETLREGFIGGYRYRTIQVRGADRWAEMPDKDMYSHVHDAGQYLMLGSGEGRALVRPKSRGDRQRFAITAASELD
jgi:hypothetical protein